MENLCDFVRTGRAIAKMDLLSTKSQKRGEDLSFKGLLSTVRKREKYQISVFYHLE